MKLFLTILFIFITSIVYSQRKPIEHSNYPITPTISNTDFIPIVKNNLNYKIQFYDFAQFLSIAASMTYPSTTGIVTFNGTGWGTSVLDSSIYWGRGYKYRLLSTSGTAPLSLTLSSNILTASMSQASTTVNGYLRYQDFVTFNNKQDALVSGTNIKSINTISLLGSGNITITGGTTDVAALRDSIDDLYNIVDDTVTLAEVFTSPTFTGTPTAPTATGGTNTTQIATTAFVQTAISGVTGGTGASISGADSLVFNTTSRKLQLYVGDSIFTIGISFREIIPTPPTIQYVTDNFNTYTIDTYLGSTAAWDTVIQDMLIISDGGVGAYVRSDHAGLSCVARTENFGNNQSAKATLTNIYYSKVGVSVRAQKSGSTYSFYYYILDDARRIVGYCNNANPTGVELASVAVTSTTGDSIRLVANGTTIRCYHNGTLDTSLNGTGIFTNSSIPSGGSPGVVGWSNNYAILDEFEGKDI